MTRILIIEDTAAIQYMLRYFFNKIGCEVDIALTLAEGKALLEKNVYCLILLDHNLPDGHGIDFLTYLRRDLKFTNPIVVMTASQQDFVENEAMKRGADDFLLKPFGTNELDKLFQKWAKNCVET